MEETIPEKSGERNHDTTTAVLFVNLLTNFADLPPVDALCAAEDEGEAEGGAHERVCRGDRHVEQSGYEQPRTASWGFDVLGEDRPPRTATCPTSSSLGVSL